MKTLIKSLLTLCAVTLLTNCVGEGQMNVGGKPNGPIIGPDGEVIPGPGENPGGIVDPNASLCGAKIWKGFDGSDLGLSRKETAAQSDRGRVKPYSTMAGEYTRAIGRVPTLLASMASTFAEPPARWYAEPEASAVNLYSSYRVAFVGCLDLTATPAQYNTAPTAGTAATECAAWATKFWSRSPSQGEVDACVKVATVDTASEPAARRKWAYTCAATLNSAGFLTY